MKRFKYKLSPLAIAFISVSLSSCILATVFSILKLTGLIQSQSDDSILDVTTVIVSIILIFIHAMICTIHYKVDSTGVKLKLGLFTIKSNSYIAEDISAVVYKTKENRLLIVKDMTEEQVFGSIININSNQFNDFVKILKNAKISFDYIEDID